MNHIKNILTLSLGIVSILSYSQTGAESMGSDKTIDQLTSEIRHKQDSIDEVNSTITFYKRNKDIDLTNKTTLTNRAIDLLRIYNAQYEEALAMSKEDMVSGGKAEVSEMSSNAKKRTDTQRENKKTKGSVAQLQKQLEEAKGELDGLNKSLAGAKKLEDNMIRDFNQKVQGLRSMRYEDLRSQIDNIEAERSKLLEYFPNRKEDLKKSLDIIDEVQLVKHALEQAGMVLAAPYMHEDVKEAIVELESLKLDIPSLKTKTKNMLSLLTNYCGMTQKAYKAITDCHYEYLDEDKLRWLNKASGEVRDYTYLVQVLEQKRKLGLDNESYYGLIETNCN